MSGGGLVLGARAEAETRVIGREQNFRKHTRSWKPNMLGEGVKGKDLGKEKIKGQVLDNTHKFSYQGWRQHYQNSAGKTDAGRVNAIVHGDGTQDFCQHRT